MILYKRNIKIRLFLLRLFLIVLLLTGTFSFLYGHNALGCASIILFLSFSFVTVTGLTVYQDSFEIIPGLYVSNDLLQVRRVFFFGLIPLNWSINKDQADEGAKIYKSYEAEEVIYTDTLLDIVLALIPRPSSFQGIIFQYKIANGDYSYLKVKLTDKEYESVASGFKTEITQPIT
jgi:hypothetical protein